MYKKSHNDDNVFIALNTDSEQLIDITTRQTILEDIRIVDRKPELAGDKVPKVDVIRDTYDVCGRDFDVVIDLDITSPFRTLSDLEHLINEYKSNSDYDLVFSVVPARRSPYFNMVEKKGDFYKKICESSFTTRQEAPASYELNASMYAYRPRFLESGFKDTILDHNCGIVVMKDYLVLDIDSEEDYKMMQVLHRLYIESDNELREVYEEAKRFVEKE